MDYKTFKDFYPFYIEEHQLKQNKIMHFMGTSLVILTIILSLILQKLVWLWLLPILGYGFAWVGHFILEKNRPATFKYPFYSLTGDFVMFWHLLTGRLSFATGAKLKIRN